MGSFYDTPKIKRIIAPLLGIFSVGLIVSFVLFNPQSLGHKLSLDGYKGGIQKGSPLVVLPPAVASTSLSSPSSTYYNEVLLCSFTQNLPSLSYSVTAVAQVGTDGNGPAYLLNGIGNTGYWYQTGLSYNWTGTGGFSLFYEVWNSSGNSIFPVDGAGGLDTLAPVYQGDTVQLSLSFSNGNVVMRGTDQNTGVSAQETYSAAGATYFQGTTTSIANSNGFNTGLMTEWHHNSPYSGGEQKVIYDDTATPITSAWMAIEEFYYSEQTGNGKQVFPIAYTRSPVTFADPTQLHTLSSNGATESITATQFITGEINPLALTFGYSIAGGAGSSSAPVLTYICAGTQQSTALSQSDQTFSLDSGTTWSVANPTASSPTETWQTNQITTGTTATSQTIDFVFYHQYLVSFGFNVIGGGTGYFAPVITCFQFGRPVTPTMGYQVWADAAQYNFPDALAGATSSGRWVSDSSSGTISSSGNIDVNYYHQYMMTSDYSIIGGGTPGAPTLVSTEFGSPVSQELTTQPQQLWVDSGATYSIPGTLLNSTASERWQADAGSTGSVVSPSTVSITYYHQYLTIARYSIIGGGTPGSPILDSTAFGLLLAQPLTTQAQQFWLDSEASYSFTNPLPNSTAVERWQSSAAMSGTVGSSSNMVMPYNHQYYVVVDMNPVEGGALSGDQGWVNAGATFQTIASPNQGWQFESWSGSGQGSYSGAGSNAVAIVNSPISETATFYPGLTIATPSHVSVSYSYGAMAGSITAGSTTAVFAPLGTDIQLVAKPDFFIYAFTGWTDSSTSKASILSISLSSPMAVKANFSLNFIRIGLIFLMPSLLVIGLAAFFLKRNRLGSSF